MQWQCTRLHYRSAGSGTGPRTAPHVRKHNLRPPKGCALIGSACSMPVVSNLGGCGAAHRRGACKCP
jgi:hypothetical protein